MHQIAYWGRQPRKAIRINVDRGGRFVQINQVCGAPFQAWSMLPTGDFA